MDQSTDGATTNVVALKPKLNGINIPQDLHDDVRVLLEMETRAMALLGGRRSMSDLVAEALRDYVQRFRDDMGDLPSTKPSDEVIRRVAQWRLKKQQEQLAQPQPKAG